MAAWESAPLVSDEQTAQQPAWQSAPLHEQPPETPGTTPRNLAKNVAAGAVEGGTSLLNIATDPFGTVIGPTIARVGGTLYDAGARLFGYPPIPPDLRNALYGQGERPAASDAVAAIDRAIPGPKLADVQANTPAEQIARKLTAATVAGGAGGAGAAVTAAGGALTGDVAARVVPEWAKPGAELVGNLAGAAATTRAVTPVRPVTTPERGRLVTQLEAEGVPLTAGERTGSKPLQKTEQMLGQLPGSAGGVAEDVATQQRAVNSAVASRAGLATDTLTPDVLNNHMRTLGTEIGNLAANNNMQLPTPFLQQIGQIRQNLRYMKSDAAQEIGARLDQLRDMITVDPAGNPVLAGPHYQTLMSELRDAITGAEGTSRRSMIDLRDRLRTQMEASMSPQDAARWRELNRFYANGAVIQDAMGGAGAGTAEGNISLLQLRGAINRSLGSDAYAKGYGDLNDLARAGQTVLRKPPDSGTPQGSFVNKLLSGGAITGAGAGSYLLGGGPMGAMMGAAAPVVMPWAIGAAMRSRPGQAYLTNQLTRNVDPRIVAAVVQAADQETERNRLMRR